uniref:UBC core domain-containing protein n=1 Tax=Aureoumbra lagunensis TaxID=44058 RepID=A0A6S8EJ73_9STRA|mmetsp:Transcript_7350/g.10220  ORF Transcript_7350/g.10220 Transcript_7350/m.10220 type:complete len:211 (-) Transcript_7350:111-743(-)
MSAYRRLRKELVEIERGGYDADVVLVPDPENLLVWRAFLRGPDDTSFSDGVFELEIKATPEYPMVPPTAKFITRIFHPNVHEKTGEVCLDVLKSEWSPAWTLASATLAIRSILAHPNAESPLNCDAGNLLRAGDCDTFNKTVRKYVSNYALKNMPQRGGEQTRQKSNALQDQQQHTSSGRGQIVDTSSSFSSWFVFSFLLAIAIYFIFPQ